MIAFYICLAVFIFVCICYFIYIQNYGLKKTVYDISYDNLPSPFDGLKVLHLTDIHRKSFGKNQNKLISLIKNSKPDLIVVSGDIIYCYNHWYNIGYNYKKDLSKVMKIFENIAKEYPVYYAPGNHECKSGYYPNIRKALISAGVIVLDSGYEIIKKDGSEIALLGLKDPTFWGGSNIVVEEYIQYSQKELHEIKNKCNNLFTMLISHRPEIYKVYEGEGVDLVFTGHAHGGQWIFPIIGPVYAPQQGFFPKYTHGVHKFNKTNVLINRGMGNSSMTIRLFNRPEVVVAVLRKNKND